jgi:hypothetical protein
MDRITKSLLDEFVSANQLTTLPEDTAFEYFCGWLIVSNHHDESLQSEDIHVGAGADCGIDCIAIIVNGSLITEPEEIKAIADASTYLDATFIFVQAERSSSFEMSKIGQIGFGVQDFFSDRPKLVQNDDVKLMARIMNEIFARGSQFKRGNPQCYVYYITTGRWANDKNLVARRDAVINDLRNLNIFRKVDFECFGAERIHQLYRLSKNAIQREIVFTDRTVLPELHGVEQAYLGLLPTTEFLKLVENENNEIIGSIFYDNVRDWQEWNPVNVGMRETIEDPAKKCYFPLLNNGITIVARQVIPTGNRFVIEDYQVVNGCQTSYVLHEMREELSPDILIPIRLIETKDPEIRNSIIKATNRQTQVTDDQLFALSDFPKSLEAYFPTFEAKKRLYYERRSRQYSAQSNIEKVRIVDQRALVRAFASIFLELPHRTTRNYKLLQKSFGTDIFNKNHKLEPYYVAAYAHYRLDYLFRSQVIASELKPARYHLLLAFRLLASNEIKPPLNSNEMQRFCESLMEILWDDDKTKVIFETAVTHVKKVAAGNFNRDNIRTETFTQNLIKNIRQNKN